MDQLGPQLWVSDMKRSLAFYKDVLGFEVRGEIDPELTHVSMSRGEATIMLSPFGNDFGGAWPAARVVDERRGSGGPVMFYIEGGNIEEDFERAKATGAKIVDELGAKPWGQVEFTIEDPDGILWALWKQTPTN